MSRYRGACPATEYPGVKVPTSAPLDISANCQSREGNCSSFELMRRCRRRDCVWWGLLPHLLVLCTFVASFYERSLSTSTLPVDLDLPLDGKFINATTKEPTNDRRSAHHVFTLSNSAWTPPVDFLDHEGQGDEAQQRSIRSVLFNSTSAAETAALHGDGGGMFLGYIRVTKTGSSSLETFAQKSTHNGYKYILRTTEFLGAMEKWRPREVKWKKQTMPACVFGRPLVLTTNGDWAPDVCPHLRYRELVRFWAKALPFLVPAGGHPLFDAVEKHRKIHMSLETFTMIRDPFDRLVSFFHYAKKIAPEWDGLNTKRQNERIREGDLVGWMQLVHTEGGGRGMDVPYQYKYFSDDLDTAISLVRGDPPRILTLLNECFEASVRLLAEKKVTFFPPGSADSFLNSTETKKNARAKRAAHEGITEATLRHLRQNATVWFADDYMFYHAAAEQFKKLLASSNLKSSELRTCRYWDGDAKEINLVTNSGLRNGI